MGIKYPKRHPTRLRGFDYSQPGWYFVTVCTYKRKHIFGDIVDGEMRLSSHGQIANFAWVKLRIRFPHIRLDQFVVMPNHVHGVICVGATLAVARPITTIPSKRAGASPAPTIGNIIGAYKSIVTTQCLSIAKSNNEYLGKLWQRNYHDHIIRDNADLHRIQEYIHDNPANWDTDRLNILHSPHQLTVKSQIMDCRQSSRQRISNLEQVM